MIEEKIKLNSKLIVVDAFKSGQKQNETPVIEKKLNLLLFMINKFSFTKKKLLTFYKQNL
jgi:hypothetical protein